MTTYTSPSAEGHRYVSGEWHESQSAPGVRFEVVRMSLRRRAELARRLRETWERQQFHQAGGGAGDQLAAAALASELDEIYLDWGLLALEGLVIDGQAADKQGLIERGPEALCREIIECIRRQCGLDGEAEKN